MAAILQTSPNITDIELDWGHHETNTLSEFCKDQTKFAIPNESQSNLGSEVIEEKSQVKFKGHHVRKFPIRRM